MGRFSPVMQECVALFIRPGKTREGKKIVSVLDSAFPELQRTVSHPASPKAGRSTPASDVEGGKSANAA